MNEYLDDLRQSTVVMKNELNKFFRGKKMQIYLVIMFAVLALVTVLEAITDGGFPNDTDSVYVSYMMAVTLLILLAATLFASTVIVSEYEERTALLLFTRPIKKYSIFLGKFLASFLTGVAFVALYYGVIAVISLVATGGVSGELLSSFGLAVIYTFAVTGVAILISSFAKKGSTAAIMTFIMLLLIFTLISSLLSTAVDPWWMVDQASASVTNVLEGYRNYVDQMIIQLMDRLGQTVTPEMLTPVPNVVRDAGVMGAWGIVSTVLAFLVFRKREF